MRGNRNQLPLAFIDTNRMVDESIEYLQAQAREYGELYLGFSGGKDSIATKQLCIMAGVKFKPYYSCTRIDPPEVVRFIKQQHPDVEFLMPSMTFWKGIIKKGPPLRMSRWCCDVLKKNPGLRVENKNRAMGIRAEESTKRASRPRTDHMKKYKINIFKPIFAWNEYHIWDFIEKNNLPYPELYDQGFHRLGCVICPFILSKSPGACWQKRESMKRWPGFWKAFKNACHIWFNGKDHTGKYINKSFEEWYQLYLNGFEK
jgi:phosphoadenosine phosphosulfate reductase